MQHIDVIIPIHELSSDEDKALLVNAINNLVECQENYKDGEIIPTIVAPREITSSDFMKQLKAPRIHFIVNDSGETDYCSQINYAVQQCDNDYFAIMEFDDEFNTKWFKFVKEYMFGKEDVSVFLPINVEIDCNNGSCYFNNEAVWANQFSNEMGYIDSSCLEHFKGANLTGGVFNRHDFLKIGGFKSAIKVAFNYEFLLRLTHKQLKAFVVPKEGYKHRVFRKNSLTDIYLHDMSEDETREWYAVAQKEYENIPEFECLPETEE